MSLEKGKSLVDQILAKLPDPLRAIVQPAFQDPQAVDAITLLGAQAATTETLTADLQRRAEQLNTDHANLQAWYTENQAALAEYNRLKAAGPTPTPTPTPTPSPTPAATGVTREELEALMAERDRGYASVLALTTNIAAQHLHRFNEVLDVDALIRHSNQHKVSLQDAYHTVHKEKISAADAAAEKARIDKLVEDGIAERLKTQAQQPFPLRGGQVEASALDLIQPNSTDADRATRYTAESAAARYEQLTQRTH